MDANLHQPQKIADQPNSIQLPEQSTPSLEVTVPKPAPRQHRYHVDFSVASPTKSFLDIFSGASMPVSTALSKILGDRIQPIDLTHGHDLLHDDTFEEVLLLSASGLIGAALAAPYCSKHSKATLKSPGPAPVRTPEFIDGLPSNSLQQQLAVEESAAIHDRSRALLSEVDQHGGLVILENPATSMTFDDPLMVQWIQTVAPFAAQASACQFGKDWSQNVDVCVQPC